MTRVGDIHNLPLEDRPNADLKLLRPWLLMHTPGAETPRWAFAYGTTQQTESVLGSAALKVPWKRTSGKPERSDFHPSRLRTPFREDARVRVGSATIGPERITAAFRTALGIGEGVSWSGEPGEVGRGRVVRLTHAAQVDTDGARFAVVATPHQYAITRRYQHLVPIYDSDEVEPEPDELEIDAEWVAALPGPMKRAIVAVPQLFTGSEEHRPFVPGHVAALTPVAVDAATMEALETALVRLYGL
jgi:hypothetical protein